MKIKKKIEIKNINIKFYSKDNKIKDGGICRGRFSLNIRENLNILIHNCFCEGVLTNGGGGIVGPNLNNNSNSIITIENCGYTTLSDYSTSIEKGSGGIAGRDTGHYQDGKIIIKNCYSKFNEIHDNSGGIVGSNLNHNSNGTIEIISCYSQGILINKCGGIVGSSSNNNSFNNIILTKCFFEGTIYEGSAGLISNYYNLETNGGNIDINICMVKAKIYEGSYGFISDNAQNNIEGKVFSTVTIKNSILINNNSDEKVYFLKIIILMLK